MADMSKILIFLVAAFLVYTFLLPWIGVSGFLASILMTVGILAALKTFAKQKWAFPWNIRGMWVVVILVIGVFMGGVFTFDSLSGLGASVMPGETIVEPIGQVEQTTPALCSVSEELKGKQATISINAWNMESNTPYSSATDLTTNCWIFKNGNNPANFIKKSNDTSDGTISGFTVGDTAYIYCGGTSYYTDPVLSFCVDSEYPTLNLETHAIESESDMQITGYDDTGGTALSSGTSNEEDYYVTMGAGAETSVYLKLKVNSANAAYDHCAWGTVTLENLTSFEPVDSKYTKVSTPTWAEDVDIDIIGSTNSTSGTYTIYKLAQAERLHEWDSLKEEFVIKAHTSNDPIQVTCSSTGCNSGAYRPAYAIALSIDCQYARGDDGKIYYDIHDHTSSEDDVGLAETETSPYGKENGVIIEAR